MWTLLAAAMVMTDVSVVTDLLQDEEKRIKSFLEQLGTKLKGHGVSYCFILLYILLSLSGISGRLTWVRLQQPARAALPSPTAACWVIMCFHNPPKSDADYGIFDVCT